MSKQNKTNKATQNTEDAQQSQSSKNCKRQKEGTAERYLPFVWSLLPIGGAPPHPSRLRRATFPS